MLTLVAFQNSTSPTHIGLGLKGHFLFLESLFHGWKMLKVAKPGRLVLVKVPMWSKMIPISQSNDLDHCGPFLAYFEQKLIILMKYSVH